MSVNGMVVGRDFTISFFDVMTNAVVNFGDVTGVRIKRNIIRIKSARYNDVPRFGMYGDGYEIDFDFVRVDPDIEDWQLTFDQTFNAGGDCPGGFLNETITYSGGVTRAFQYPGFVFNLEDIADISREKNVTSRGRGMASDKVPIS